ncbi:unnamed protein product [Thlaspi arvense]|uniref:Gnk2-homologous domain-containing protein n=1 Tax=Thlaspi arvense TaxID=13288 RepID=A0AAU9RXC5_THLAR|nr:unnamed protein product [Thlaspi arvense]
MYSLSSVSKRFVLVHIVTVVAIQLLHTRSVSSVNMTNSYLHHKCIESQGKYQHGSQYEKNLNEMINATSSGNFRQGYESMTNGEGTPDSVTFLYQCRGDIDGRMCRSCYATAIAGLRRRCPRNKGSIIWYDQCLMEISSVSTDGQVDYVNNISTNEKNFDANGQPFLYAAGEKRLGTKTMYAMHKCLVSQGHYKPGSVYEKNLKSIIQSITSTGQFRSGYELMSLGDGPDFISVIIQCRDDSYGPKCRSCYSTALSELRRRCPREKGGIIWYDQCLLEISGIDTKGKVDYENNFCLSNAKKVSGDQSSFHLNLMSLISNLTSIAINETNLDGDQHAQYAAGERRLGTKNLYGMVQCTKDLSLRGCQTCLGYLALHFQNCYGRKQGARVFGRSCSFRFELYPFVSTKAGSKYLKV